LDAIELLSLLHLGSFKAFVSNIIQSLWLLLSSRRHPNRPPQNDFIEKSLIMLRLLSLPAALLVIAIWCNFPLNAQTATDPAAPKPAVPPAGAPVAPTASRSYDPLLDLPPLPRNKVSLMGGTIAAVDQVQNHMVVQAFGGKQKLHLNLDMRTRIYNDGKPAALRDLKSGQRVYVDTMLNGSKVFAKSIWIQSAVGTGDARGQVLGYDSERRILNVRDEVSAQPINFHLAPDAVVRWRNAVGSFSDLTPGSLVSLSFGPQQGSSGFVREITLLAQPGSSFTFLGKVTFVDLSKKLMGISNQNDNKSYDLSVATIPTSILQSLREGGTAAVSAAFDGTQYVAQKVEIVQAGGLTDQNEHK
jgi:hypothetical protein